MAQRVLVTRLGWFLSHRLAAALERDPDVEYVLGIDTDEPRGELERTEYLRADVRRPVVPRILEATRIDTVVHLGLYSTPREAANAGAMHDLNVIGAMQVLAACQKAESVKRVIVRSSTAVYGAAPDAPAIATEDMPFAGAKDPFATDVGEVEEYARELQRRRPDIEIVVLRFANILGPTAETPLAQYLAMPVVPTPLGYDPRLQFIHESDAIDLLVQAVRSPVPGTFNAAGDGAVYLSQAIRMGARVQLPLPTALLNLTAPVVQAFGRSLEVPPHILRLVRWGRIADNARLKEIFGFTPRRTTKETVQDYYAEHRLRRLTGPQRQEPWERDLQDFLTRKGQERFLTRIRPGSPTEEN